MRSLAAVLLILLAVVFGACSAASSPSPTVDPAAVVLLVEDSGGPGTPEEQALRYPRFALSGDGRVIVPGPVPAIFPGPALPNLQTMRLSSAGVQRVAQAAIDAGLTGANRDLGVGGGPDAPATVFRTPAHETRIASFDVAAGPEAAALQALTTQLQDLRSVLGADVAAGEQPYEPTAMRLVTRPENPAAGPDAQFVNVRDWPQAIDLGTAGEALGGTSRCVLVEGADVGTIVAAARGANQLTYWRSGDKTYRVDFRPLYPHESGCQTG
jgi:hypothetical protein